MCIYVCSCVSFIAECLFAVLLSPIEWLAVIHSSGYVTRVMPRVSSAGPREFAAGSRAPRGPRLERSPDNRADDRLSRVRAVACAPCKTLQNAAVCNMVISPMRMHPRAACRDRRRDQRRARETPCHSYTKKNRYIYKVISQCVAEECTMANHCMGESNCKVANKHSASNDSYSA